MESDVIRKTCFGGLFALLVGSLAQAHDTQDHPPEVHALASAWEAAEKARLPMAGHTIVVRPIREYIVVSARAQCSVAGSCYGGRAHFVYSPKSRKIVHVLAED